MNILFSCDEYPPAKTGGIGSATKTVAEALAKEGHNVYVVSGRLDKTLPKETVINGVTIYRLYLMQEVSWLFKNYWLADRLHVLCIQKGLLAKKAIREYQRKHDFMEKIIRDKSIDVVEVTDYAVLNKYFNSHRPNIYKKFSVPSVARIHGSRSFLQFYRQGYIDSMSKANDKAFLESCDKILSVSKFSADFINNQLGVDKNVDVIYNPLVSTFADLAKDINVERTKSIVFLGKIFETKGAFNLIKAFNNFAKTHEDYQLIMIGGGFIEQGKEMVEEDLRNRVTFTGFLQAPDIARYLKSAAFCVIPTFFENFSVAALEVMGCENILIYTTEASGPETITDGVDGFLVNPHDVKAIEEKMSYVADNLDQLIPMRKVAADKIRTLFSENIIINKLEAYYISIRLKS